jgi:hypothetical protein
MQRYNHVCFDCRISNRIGSICSQCGKETRSIGYRLLIPKKNDIKGWSKLRELVRRKYPSPSLPYTEKGV